MLKREYRLKYLWIGLIVFMGFTGLFSYISGADQKIEIKKEILKKDSKGESLVECWSRPKSPDGIPYFFKGYEEITNQSILFKKIIGLPFGNSVAFLVGVSKYKYLSPQLPFVENDLKELANSLLTKNGFDTVYIVKNEAVTPILIRDYLLNKFRKELNSNDRLLFYYSGHGADIGDDTGYMQFSTFKSMDDYDINRDVLNITDCEHWSKLIKIKHMLFVFDCCASGLGLTPKGLETERPPTFFALSGNGSRTVITAGTGKENAYAGSDYSVFTKALLTTLNDDNLFQANKGFLTIREVYDQIKRKVSQSTVKQTPNIWGLEENKYQGNFIFINTRLQKVKLSKKDLLTLDIAPNARVGTVIGEFGIIHLTSYLTGKVYIDDVEVGDIKSGDKIQYINQPVGLHRIKVVSGEIITLKTLNVVKGKIVSLTITAPEVQIKNVAESKISPAKTFLQFGHKECIKSIAFSSNGKFALSGGNDENLKLWDINTDTEVKSFDGYAANSVAFSPDRKYALLGNGKTLKLLDLNSGKEIRQFKGHSGFIYSVAFSPDGKYALSGSKDSTLKLWNINTGKEIRSFSRHTQPIYSVAFSPDGKYALSGGEDLTLKLWGIETGKEIRSFRGHASFIGAVAFSPDGKYALSGSWDTTLKLWEIKTGQEVRRFVGHSDIINSVAFSPDGKYALSGSNDHTLKLWEIETGKEIRSFKGHRSIVLSVAFSPDGKYALSVGEDRTLRLWEVSTKKTKRFVLFPRLARHIVKR